MNKKFVEHLMSKQELNQLLELRNIRNLDFSQICTRLESSSWRIFLEKVSLKLF